MFVTSRYMVDNGMRKLFVPQESAKNAKLTAICESPFIHKSENIPTPAYLVSREDAVGPSRAPPFYSLVPPIDP